MSFWSIREELSQASRIRRSYYELLRDELDQHMTRYALIDSYQNFRKSKVSYPWVEKRELKPRAILPDLEYEDQNTFLVIFVEDTISAHHKKYIRFFDRTKTTKANLLRTQSLPLEGKLDRYQKYLESAQFFDFMEVLLPVDYALLIQRDPATRSRHRYKLTHFHVRIDWPIADAAEDLARHLRYISKDLYEKGDTYAEAIQKKFFDYFGLPMMVGGRRTAACVAAQYLRRLPCITTIYAASSESRALLRFSEKGGTRMILMKFKPEELREIAEKHNLSLQRFTKNYVVTKEGKDSVCIFQVTYSHTGWARPPDDGKLREIKTEVNWLSVDTQHLMPLPGIENYPPLPLNIIYT